MEPTIDELIRDMLNTVLTLAMGPNPELADASHAVEAGTATDAQLALVTRVIHNAFDDNDGCMVSTLREMIDKGAPHYFVNHAIRTYVRLVDKRESVAAHRA